MCTGSNAFNDIVENHGHLYALNKSHLLIAIMLIIWTILGNRKKSDLMRAYAVLAKHLQFFFSDYKVEPGPTSADSVQYLSINSLFIFYIKKFILQIVHSSHEEKRIKPTGKLHSETPLLLLKSSFKRKAFEIFQGICIWNLSRHALLESLKA